MTNIKLRHSFSAFEQFDNCPKAYHHLRIAKDVVEVQGEALLNGNRVHTAFEERLKDKTPLPDDLAKHENKCVAIENIKGEVIPEEEFAITKEFVPTSWWSDDVWLRLKADVSAQIGRTGLILDWKTGKRRPKFFQLELGAFMQMLHYPVIEKVKTAFIWLRDDTSDDELYTRKEDYNRVAEKVSEKVFRIEQALKEDVWQAKPGPLCNYCAAKDICSFSNAKGRRR